MMILNDSKVLAENVDSADTFWKRLKGLLGKKRLEEGEGLLLYCSSVHCFFMKFTIDAVYLSADMTVLDKETLAPWRVGRIVPGAKYVLELPEDAAAPINKGDRIESL
jgi:hypothetical protein